MLRNKYRPKNFKTFIGNGAIVKSLKKNLDKNIFLFHGPRGCGKTTLARIIANKKEADINDIYEINASNKTGVDDARLLEETARLLPTFGKHKIYMIDEIHRMTGNAQDSLLKIFEEPPDHVTFVLCTTEVNKVLKTVRSRCFEYQLKPLNRKEIEQLLYYVIKKEDLQDAIEEDIIIAICKNCDGIPREALTLLDSVKSLSKKEALNIIKEGSDEDIDIREICQSLINKEPWKILKNLLEGFEKDAEKARRGIFAYLGAVADNSNNINKMEFVHMLQESFEENVYDNGLVGLKKQIREAYILSLK